MTSPTFRFSSSGCSFSYSNNTTASVRGGRRGGGERGGGEKREEKREEKGEEKGEEGKEWLFITSHISA